MMTATLSLVIIGLIVAVYLIISNRLIALMHPVRMGAVELAEQIVSDPGTSSEAADAIRRALDRSYSTTHAWLYTFAIPVAIVLALRDQFSDHSKQPQCPGIPNKLQGDMLIFRGLTLLSTISNSPLAMLLFGVQLTAYMILFCPIGASIKKLLSVSDVVDARAGSFPFLIFSKRTA